jgi:hypothetical protein
MIILLALFYIGYAAAFYYSHKYGYSLLRYLYKRKNISVLLSIEIIFLILTSFVVFTSEPFKWAIAVLMLMHLVGITWLVSNPNSYYEMYNETMGLDEDMMETSVVSTLLIFAMLALILG